MSKVRQTIQVKALPKTRQAKLNRALKAHASLPEQLRALVVFCANQLPNDLGKSEIGKRLTRMVEGTFEQAIKSDPSMADFVANGFNMRKTTHGPRIKDPTFGYFIRENGTFRTGAGLELDVSLAARHMREGGIAKWNSAPTFARFAKTDTKSKPRAKQAKLAKGSKIVVDSFLDTLIDTLIYTDDTHSKFASKQVIVARIKSVNLAAISKVA